MHPWLLAVLIETNMKTDRLIIIFTLLLAGIYFYAIEQIQVLDIGDPIGPKAIPRFLGVALLISVGLLYFEVRAKARKGIVDEESNSSVSKGETWVFIGIAAWTTLYFVVFEWLGYAIATAIYLNVLMAYFNPGKLKTNVLTATLFSFISYFSFTKLFGTELAPGLLPF